MHACYRLSSFFNKIFASPFCEASSSSSFKIQLKSYFLIYWVLSAVLLYSAGSNPWTQYSKELVLFFWYDWFLIWCFFFVLFFCSSDILILRDSLSRIESCPFMSNPNAPTNGIVVIWVCRIVQISVSSVSSPYEIHRDMSFWWSRDRRR